jgi:acyl-CoA thioesterase
MGSGAADPGGGVPATGVAGRTTAGAAGAVAGAAVGRAGCQAEQPAQIEATHRSIESGIASRVRVMPEPPLAAQSPGDRPPSDMTQVITRRGHGGAPVYAAAMAAHREDPGVGPIAGLLGIRRASMGEGRSTFALAVRPEHMNPHGSVHGGVVYTLVDFAMGAALTSLLEPGERCATLEVKINYLAPTLAGELRAEASVVSRSRRVAVMEARVYGEGEQLTALATGSFYVQTRTG